MTRRELYAHMRRLGACPESFAWVQRTNGTPSQLWARCTSAAWLEWLAAYACVPNYAAAAASHAESLEWSRVWNETSDARKASAAGARAFRKHIPWRVVAAALRKQAAS